MSDSSECTLSVAVMSPAYWQEQITPYRPVLRTYNDCSFVTAHVYTSVPDSQSSGTICLAGTSSLMSEQGCATTAAAATRYMTIIMSGFQPLGSTQHKSFTVGLQLNLRLVRHHANSAAKKVGESYALPPWILKLVIRRSFKLCPSVWTETVH